MKTYLSVDLDFFNPWDHYLEEVETMLVLIIRQARKRNIPLLAVMNHQQLLPVVNASRARRLVNVDEHSDVTEGDISELDCGSWVSYVRWRAQGHYHWVRNCCSTSRGNCNGELSWGEDTEWRKVTSVNRADHAHVGPDYVTSPRHRCVGVGLCMSPSFSTAGLQDLFRRIVAEEGVPYKKGRRQEKYSRKIKPPYSIAA